MSGALLEVRNLLIRFPTDLGPVHAVNGVSFSVARGERLGLAGESGSGKTVTGLAIMGLLRGAEVSGEIVYDGADVLALTPREQRRLRGGRIAMVFQNPLSSLNPVMTVGSQIIEAIRAHRDLSRREARVEAADLLRRVGIPDPERNADEFPHRFSGGMRQRAMIAIALSADPELLIADEPTTALDVTIQAQIIELLAELSAERGMAVILITHNLGLLAGFAERIVVAYSGRVMEDGDVETIYYEAAHPYTWGLMASMTRLDQSRRKRLTPIPGSPPSALSPLAGCVFHSRCDYAQAVCEVEVPALVPQAKDGHCCACHFAGRLAPPTSLQETAT